MTTYTESEINRIIEELTKEFSLACEHYNNTLIERASNRARKELSKRNLRGSKMHRFESDFAWIIHNIKMGPVCLVDDEVQDACELINVIKSTS
jgi:hypothetical protein